MFSLEEQVAEPANMDRTSKSFEEFKLWLPQDQTAKS
jgi:hypothetical protein